MYNGKMYMLQLTAFAHILEARVDIGLPPRHTPFMIPMKNAIINPPKFGNNCNLLLLLVWNNAQARAIAMSFPLNQLHRHKPGSRTNLFYYLQSTIYNFTFYKLCSLNHRANACSGFT
jgi:hypothetical protein